MFDMAIRSLIISLLLLAAVESITGQATPDEWTLNYTRTYCAAPQAGNRNGAALECKREPTAWRWLYVDELDLPSSRLIREESLEERLANIIYLSTIAKAFKNDINFYKFNAQSETENRLNQELVSGNRVNDTLCTLHLKQMIEAMKNLESQLVSQRRDVGKRAQLEDEHVYLARVLDSFGRYSSGHLSGRFHIFGAYDQCIRSQLLLSGKRKVSTRYCIANLQMDSFLSTPIRERIRYPHETGNALLHVGICVPDSCHSKSFNQNQSKLLIKQILETQFSLPQTLYKNRNLELDSVFCLVDEGSEYNGLSTASLMFLSTIVIWLITICYYSSDLTARQNPNHPMNVFSSSWQLSRESSLKSEATPVDLKALDSVKVVAQMTIMMLHAGSFMGGFTDDFLPCAVRSEQDPFMSGLIMFTSMVDTFFTLNGMIHTYNLLKELQMSIQDRRKIGWFLRFWFRFALKRYLRLVPMLFLVLAFKKTLFVHLDNGPMWDKGLNQDTSMGYCLQRQSWLSAFDLSALKILLPYNCVTVAWSVANEIIFALILPPIVFLIHWNWRRGLQSIGLLVMISTICCYQAFNNSDLEALFELRDLRSYASASLPTVFFDLYVSPLFRLSSFLVGVLGGWYLFYQESKVGAKGRNGQRPSLIWPSWFGKIATHCSLLIQLTNIVLSCKATLIRTQLSPYHRNFIPMMFSTNRLIFSLAYVVLFLRIATDWRYNWVVRNLASGKCWTILSRLNYLLLLVHWDVMTYDFGIRTQEVFCSRWLIWSLFARAYLTSLAMSVLLYSLVQNPLNRFIQYHVLDRI